MLTNEYVSNMVLYGKFGPNLVYRPSYTWQSMLFARSIVEKVMCWYVGNWQSILVQKDNWIFSLESYLANYTPLNGLDANALVVDLINQDPKW